MPSKKQLPLLLQFRLAQRLVGLQPVTALKTPWQNTSESKIIALTSVPIVSRLTDAHLALIGRLTRRASGAADIRHLHGSVLGAVVPLCAAAAEPAVAVLQETPMVPLCLYRHDT